MSSTNMNTKINIWFAAFMVVLIAVVALSLVKLLSSDDGVGISPAGSTFSNAKIASVVLIPATGTATSTFLLNTDSNDRYITGAFAYCTSVGTSQAPYTGAGLAQFLIQMSTSSATTATSIGNSNFAANLLIATSSAYAYTASTTAPVTGNAGRIWASGSYLGVFANATNTAQCVTGVNYLAS